jgi:hypothetical protein
VSRIWRDPAVETEDYPNLTVHDGRVTGSINVGHSRLPLWAIVPTALESGWADVQAGWPHVTTEYGFTSRDLSAFLYYLLEQRGEFGRLLCILADVERQERERDEVWWEHPDSVERVAAQLRTCLAALAVAS